MLRGQRQTLSTSAGSLVRETALLALCVGVLAGGCRSELDELRPGETWSTVDASWHHEEGGIGIRVGRQRDDAGGSPEGGVEVNDSPPKSRASDAAVEARASEGGASEGGANSGDSRSASLQPSDGSEGDQSPDAGGEAMQQHDSHLADDAGAPAAPMWAMDAAVALARPTADSSLAVPHDVIVIDGDLSEWSSDEWVMMSHRSTMSTDASPGMDKDFSATLALRWTAEALYLAVMVLDDVHDNTHSGFELWNGDSLQVAFDTGAGRHPYDWEYGFALTTEGEAEARSWLPESSEVTQQAMDFTVRRFEGATVYEIAFEPIHLGAVGFPSDVRLSAAVNESDGSSRVAALELVQGIVSDPKTAEEFVPLRWLPPR